MIFMIDLKHVETFHCIVRLGSFSAAAIQLRTTQPAISARIRELERELGVKLFSTSSRRASLTPKGAEFVRHAEELLALVKRITNSIGNLAEMPARIRLGATETTATTWLENFVERVLVTYPNVVLDVDIGLTGDIWRRYHDGFLDMIIVPAANIENKVEAVRLGDVPCQWIAGSKFDLQNSSLTPAELGRLPLISLSSESALFQLADQWFRAQGVSPNWVNFSSSMSMVTSLIKLGLGVSLLPVGVLGAGLEGENIQIIDVQPDDFLLSFFAVYDSYSTSPILGEVARIAAEASTFTKSA